MITKEERDDIAAQVEKLRQSPAYQQTRRELQQVFKPHIEALDRSQRITQKDLDTVVKMGIP